MQEAIYLAGPTASGKSAVAMELAGRLGGEIVSVDSMQVYRGMDIGTAKPGIEEQKRVPHHLIDVADLGEEFDAARFVKLARHAESEIRARGHTPIFCGGTGLYFNALAYGLSEAGTPDASLRAEIEATPLPSLLEELARRDAETFARIDRSNPRRVVRAIELLRTTGRAIREVRPDWSRAAAAGRWAGLERERGELNARIDRRVDEMIARGLVAETDRLLTQGLEKNRTAMQALGYRQMVEHLRRERGLPETVALIKQKTRQYAKRQMTWFRNQPPIEWFSARPESSAAELARAILAPKKTA